MPSETRSSDDGTSTSAVSTASMASSNPTPLPPKQAPPNLLRALAARHNTLALLFDVDKTTCDTRQFQGGSPKIRAGIQGACHTLYACGHAVAFISGRTLPRLQNATGDNFPLAARHGRALVLSSGEVVRVGPHVDLNAEISAAEAFAGSLNLACWNDGESVEIGFQGRERLKSVVEIFMRHLVQRRPHELQLLALKKVTEIIPCGVGKGVALDYFMDNDPRFTSNFVVYFGDDANDIPAGRAAQRRGGLLVWVGDYAAAVDAGADYYVADPAAVEQLLVELFQC